MMFEIKSQRCLPASPVAWALLLLVSGIAAFQPAAADGACQEPGWNMTRELKAFGRPALKTAAGNGPWNTPSLKLDTLYAVKLRTQSEVQYVQEPVQAAKATLPLGGVTRFTAPVSGTYRVTIDVPLWIDIATPGGVIAPVAFNGWHECSIFRKSVAYRLEAGQPVTLQFSGASSEVIKITVEPPQAL